MRVEVNLFDIVKEMTPEEMVKCEQIIKTRRSGLRAIKGLFPKNDNESRCEYAKRVHNAHPLFTLRDCFHAYDI